MKAVGISRGIDSMGRIVIPAALRRTLGIYPSGEVEIYTEGNSLVISKYCTRGKACKNSILGNKHDLNK